MVDDFSIEINGHSTMYECIVDFSKEALCSKTCPTVNVYEKCRQVSVGSRIYEGEGVFVI